MQTQLFWNKQPVTPTPQPHRPHRLGRSLISKPGRGGGLFISQSSTGFQSSLRVVLASELARGGAEAPMAGRGWGLAVTAPYFIPHGGSSPLRYHRCYFPHAPCRCGKTTHSFIQQSCAGARQVPDTQLSKKDRAVSKGRAPPPRSSHSTGGWGELSGMESSRRERMYRILCVLGLQPHLGAWWAWATAPNALGCCRPVLSILDVWAGGGTAGYRSGVSLIPGDHK